MEQCCPCGFRPPFRRYFPPSTGVENEPSCCELQCHVPDSLDLDPSSSIYRTFGSAERHVTIHCGSVSVSHPYSVIESAHRHSLFFGQGGPDYPLCRLYHGRGPRRAGAPADQLPNFYHAVLTRLNVQCTLKRNNN